MAPEKDINLYEEDLGDVVLSLPEEPLRRVVAIVEILHEHYDHFLTFYKLGEFNSPEKQSENFRQMLAEFATVNERTAVLFRQIASIMAKEERDRGFIPVKQWLTEGLIENASTGNVRRRKTTARGKGKGSR